MREAHNKAGPRMVEAGEIHRFLHAANPVTKGRVLFGVKCGFRNTDVTSLPQPAFDLVGGWIDFPRPRIAIPRRIPLWAESVRWFKGSTEGTDHPGRLG